MVPASKYKRGASRFAGNSVGSMATDVVKGTDDVVLAQHDQNGKAVKLQGYVIAWFGKAAAMGNTDPCLRT